MFEHCDIWLTPTMAVPPQKIGYLEFDPDDPGECFARMDQFTAFTQIANGSGIPAMSVPLHWSEQGLPIGVQFMAPYGDEGLVFRVAGQLERARPWRDRIPPVNAAN